MKPDRTNYEIWILDYLDGRLNEEQTCLLMKFLDENPDIREELSFLAEFNITPEDKKYPFKNKLKKSITDLPEDQFELLCVSALENDISSEETEELMQYLESRPEKRNIFNQIQKIKLHPPVVEFRNKNKLRKRGIAEKTIRFLFPVLSAAACFFIAIWIFTSDEINNKNNNNITLSDEEIQQKNPDKIATPEIVTPYTTKTYTTETKQNRLPRKNITPVMPIPSPDLDENSRQEIIIPSPLAFKDNLVLSQIAIEKIMPDVKFNSTIAINNKETDQGLKYYFTKFVREKILRTNSGREDAIKSYEIAEASIKGLNKILGWQMSFNEYTDEKGELLAINFNSKLIKINIPVKRNETSE